MSATATAKPAPARSATPHTERARFFESGNAFAIYPLRAPTIEQLHNLPARAPTRTPARRLPLFQSA